jgi:hypothetical protein
MAWQILPIGNGSIAAEEEGQRIAHMIALSSELFCSK